MARTFECRACGDSYENPAGGRPPVRCVNCDPMAWREEARAAALARRRALEAHAADTPAPTPAPAEPVCLPLRPPKEVTDNPRLALSLAVRHVGRAQGRIELHRALRDLQSVVRAWLASVD